MPGARLLVAVASLLLGAACGDGHSTRPRARSLALKSDDGAPPARQPGEKILAPNLLSRGAPVVPVAPAPVCPQRWGGERDILAAGR